MTEATKNCIFCNIISEKDKNVTILHKDDEIVIIADKYPAAKHHFLVIPIRHIENVKYLTPEDLKLVSKMDEIGTEKMKELGGDLNDMRSGFNWPPANTISHLHQHFISPGSSLSFFRKIMFSHNNYFFVSAQYIMKRLTR